MPSGDPSARTMVDVPRWQRAHCALSLRVVGSATYLVTEEGHMRRIFSLVLAGLLLAGLASPAAASRSSYSVLTAMTYNLYVGTDLFELLNPVEECEEVPPPLTPEQCSLIVQAGAALEDVEKTNFEERAKTIARLIANRRADVVGLQEVSRITTIPTDPFGNPVGPPVVTDYLEILLKALEAQGAKYQVAASVDNADVGPIPAGTFTPQGPIVENLAFLLDRDAILVRTGLEIDPKSVASAPFAPDSQLVIPIGGQDVEFTRSWVKVDVTKHGKRYAVANTHLEVEFEPGNIANGLQTAQAVELVKVLAQEDDPTVLLGDMNSGPKSDNGLPGIPTPYQVLGSSGFADAWTAQVFSSRPGYTCCQAELLDNPTTQLDQRIDQVWLGNGLEPRFIFANTVGDRVWQKTPSGLWPSDHAGVVAYLFFR